MFKKIAADALGLSDIGVVVQREDYDKTDADDFILHEIDEKIYFLIKTKADEYCFTNRAILHVDGESAMSKNDYYVAMTILCTLLQMFFSKQQEQLTLMSKLSLQSVILHFPSTFINALLMTLKIYIKHYMRLATNKRTMPIS